MQEYLKPCNCNFFYIKNSFFIISYKWLLLVTWNHIIACKRTLFGLVLWHINSCRLFSAKSILYISTVLFQRIQFSISTQFNSIWPINRTLSGATTPGQSESGSEGNKGLLHIPQNSSITLMSYQDTRCRSLTPLQRCSLCILQPQPSGSCKRTDFNTR